MNNLHKLSSSLIIIEIFAFYIVVNLMARRQKSKSNLILIYKCHLGHHQINCCANSDSIKWSNQQKFHCNEYKNEVQKENSISSKGLTCNRKTFKTILLSEEIQREWVNFSNNNGNFLIISKIPILYIQYSVKSHTKSLQIPKAKWFS